ncbi:MAG: nucleotidyl transferase AbiEii/AbiGii toxin family protein [Acidobacteria bacterium]|nr:MAG: nucleotidyl transferase AbiEii/AbiGii toxin family protein [Acidobacteriota bacterium]
MQFDEIYRRQAALLVRAIPFVGAETCFALKGGTAINLFVRDMPRLSVDIDLTYLPIAARAQSLQDMGDALRRIADAVEHGIAGARVDLAAISPENRVTKLLVRAKGVQIKIEVTPVTRGCVHEPAAKSVSPRVEDEFGFAEIQVVSFADLYAGKLVAALDRQHPRDLFDVHGLLSNEGIDQVLRKTFIVYVLSHNRPMAELLAPTRRDISAEFRRGFQGMTESPVDLDELLEARESLIREIVGNMPLDHRRFLISAKRCQPEWDLLSLPGVQMLPAVRWKLENLARLEGSKRAASLERLVQVLEVDD